MSSVKHEFIKLVDKIFGEIYEEVKRIRKITDSEKQENETRKAMRKSRNKWNSKVYDFWLKHHKENELGSWRDIDQELFDVYVSASSKKYENHYSPYKLLKDILYKVNNNATTNRRERESKSSQSTQHTEQTQSELIYCQSCFEEIPTKKTYYYNTKKKDGFKFCSNKCYINFYGEDCIKCWKKFLMVYLIKEDNNPNHTYCWDCRKEIIKERKELSKKYCETCKIELTEKNEWNNFICKSCKEKEVDEMLRKSYGKNKEANLDREQNRTEQNRTEQNRTEQNRTEQNASSNVNQETAELTNQINNLQKEINHLEKRSFVGDQNSSNPQQQNLLKEKKEELENLENKLKEKQLKSEQKQNNSKLILGIGGGILGLGLIGLVIYLIMKGKKK